MSLAGGEWGLRDYGEEANVVWGGDPDCEHEWVIETTKHDNLRPSKVSEKTVVGSNKELRFRTGEKVGNALCVRCGAYYGQLGLEPNPFLYIEHLIMIFREAKRVLKPHGNCFVVIDDSYIGSHQGYGAKKKSETGFQWVGDGYYASSKQKPPTATFKGAPRKSMALIPELFAIRMVYDLGFILRNKIIWAKKIHIYKERKTIGNAMPESTKDRLAHTWEYIYHFVKEPKYYYDLDSVRVQHKTGAVIRLRDKSKEPYNQSYPGGAFSPGARPEGHPLGANPGDVLQTNTEPFPEAHFSVFPASLVEFLIKVGCPQEICKKCGKPRERIVERGEFVRTGGKRVKDTPAVSEQQKREGTGYHQLFMVGWTDCGCGAGWESSVVLDPFLGSGTTALVALKLGRRFVGVEINYDYCLMALRRIEPYLKQRKLEEFS